MVCYAFALLPLVATAYIDRKLSHCRWRALVCGSAGFGIAFAPYHILMHESGSGSEELSGLLVLCRTYVRFTSCGVFVAGENEPRKARCVNRSIDVPNRPHWGIVQTPSVFIPGDDGSRT